MQCHSTTKLNPYQSHYPTLILPDDAELVAKLKLKLAIYQRRLSILKTIATQRHTEIHGAWYVVKILEHLLAQGECNPTTLFATLSQQQQAEGYGSKVNLKAYAAWVFILFQYVSYRQVISVDMTRLK